MHISIVEDNPSVLAMLETALVLCGHKVEPFSDTSSFLWSLQRTAYIPPYDLVIVDLFLDQLSGTDIVDALRITQPQSIPAILISASEESTLAPIRRRYPDLPILQKPFKIQELMALISKITSTGITKLQVI
jgi:DNA-binding response OmpR family regulator